MTHRWLFGLKLPTIPSAIPPLLRALALWSMAVLLSACQSAVAVPPGSGVAVTVPGGMGRIAVGACGLPGQVVVTNRAGKNFMLFKAGRNLGLKPIAVCPATETGREPGMLPDGLVGRGRLTIKKTWLAGPTRRYRHGILGDAVEAGELRVNTEDGRRHTFTLDSDSVFEDLLPRVVDLDGDGQEEVLLVRSRLGKGSSTALFGIVKGKLKLVAESKPFGLANRWLNPVGVADFDGDDRREIAVVVTPHIGGTLTLYEKKGTRLVVKHSQYGFSNHFIGSRELGMSAILDFNGDLVADLAVPGRARESLRIVTFAGGRFAEIRRFRYGQKIVTAILKANFGTQIRPDLVFGLQDGTLVVLSR